MAFSSASKKQRNTFVKCNEKHICKKQLQILSETGNLTPIGSDGQCSSDKHKRDKETKRL